MAEIHIVQEHKLSHKAARAAAQQVAEKMAAEYSVEYRWDGDVLRFARSGVEGTLAIEAQRAVFDMRLSFPASIFAATVREKVTKKMREVFGAAALVKPSVLR